jgi:hypothetical protein
MGPFTRKFVAAACCGAALAITLALLVEARSISTTSDEALVLGFHGAAYEDIFGFGFWPTWALISLVVLPLLLSSWVLIRMRLFRSVILLVLVGFAATTVFSHNSYSREEKLWATREKP